MCNYFKSYKRIQLQPHPVIEAFISWRNNKLKKRKTSEENRVNSRAGKKKWSRVSRTEYELNAPSYANIRQVHVQGDRRVNGG